MNDDTYDDRSPEIREALERQESGYRTIVRTLRERRLAQPWEPRLEALRPELSDDLYHRIVALVEDALAQGDAEHVREMEGLVDALAEHFPGLGPALRAVADHWLNRMTSERDRCRESMRAVLDTHHF